MMMPKPFWMLLLLSGLSVTLLLGCHRTAPTGSHANGTPTETPTSNTERETQTPPPAAANRPIIVAFGDSLTAGYGTNAGESYPDYLQRDLNARGYHYSVVNAGISGNTTKDGLLRVSKVIALHPAIAIVAFGGNDGLRGIPIRDTEMNLKTIVSELQDAHIQVILGGITLPPNYGRAYISEFNEIYTKLAKQYRVPLLPFMLKDVYGVPGAMQNDGIHASGKGNKQVAKNFLPLLLPLLHKSNSNQ